MQFKRHRTTDSESCDDYRKRHHWFTVPNIIAFIVFISSIGGLYADNLRRHTVNEKEIEQLKKSRDESREDDKMSRIEMKEQIKEVRSDVKIIQRDIQRILQEVSRSK